jgi:hypothetical protein
MRRFGIERSLLSKVTLIFEAGGGEESKVQRSDKGYSLEIMGRRH